jgi:hypothetical protein
MVTAISETKPTKTVKRLYLLQLQVRNLLSRTTDLTPYHLETLGGKAISNQWLEKVSVYGLDATNRCHAGLELEINWLTHTLEVVVWGENVTVNKTMYTDDCAPEVMNAIVVFNHAVIEQCLTTECRVTYAPGVDRARVDRELGLVLGAPIYWAGPVSQQAFGVSELPELKVRLLIAESNALVPVTSKQQPKGKSTTEPLFARIKHAFGES